MFGLGKDRIAVTGASGHLGRSVLRLLRDQERVPRRRLLALARDPAKVDLGVAVRPFDYDVPARQARSLRGVRTLLLVSTWDFDRRLEQHRCVLAAAKEAGVEHVVYASAVSPGEKDHLTGAHPATERLLKESGLGWTAVRATLYMSLFDEDVRAAARTGEHPTSLGSAKAALVDRWDLARADAAVLADPGSHDGRAYTVTGPSAVGADELAAVAAELRGKPVEVRRLSRAATAKALAARGLGERDIDITLGLEDKIRSGVYAKVSPDLRDVVGDDGSGFRETMLRRLRPTPPL